MIYTDAYKHDTALKPAEEWQSAVGIWEDKNGELFSFPDAIARGSGTLTIDNPKQKALALFALNYAKQRREQTLRTAAAEIERLDAAIAQLNN